MPVIAFRPPRSTRPQTGLWTLDEAAAWFGVAPRTLKRWFVRDGITHVKIGRHTYVSQAALDGFIERHTVPAVEEN